MALATGVPPLFTPLDWDRYYLLPVIFSTMCSAIALAWGITILLNMIQRNAGMRLFKDTECTSSREAH